MRRELKAASPSRTGETASSPESHEERIESISSSLFLALLAMSESHEERIESLVYRLPAERPPNPRIS